MNPICLLNVDFFIIESDACFVGGLLPWLELLSS